MKSCLDIAACAKMEISAFCRTIKSSTYPCSMNVAMGWSRGHVIGHLYEALCEVKVAPTPFVTRMYGISWQAATQTLSVHITWLHDEVQCVLC